MVKIRLYLRGLVLLGLAMVGPRLGEAAVQSEPARIVVRADQALAPVSPMLFGQNYGPWMNTTETFVADYRDAGVTLPRFPAGNWGDENDVFPNNVDDLAMGQAAGLADALGAEVSVQARSYRSGTPEKAAETVRYSNVENDYGFRYWEVGNEPDLYQRRSSRSGDPDFTVDWYKARTRGAHFREFAAGDGLREAVDPEIQVVGPAVTGGWREWIPAFFAANGDLVDVISWHWYPHGDEMTDAQVLATPVQIEQQVEAIRAWWTDPAVNPLGHERPLPPIFLSEYNVSWASSVRRHLGSQVAALWNAEVVGRMANLGVEMAAHGDRVALALQGTSWQGLIGDRVAVGMLEDPRPVYGVYRGDRVAWYSHWGTTQVDAESSDGALLPAFASLREDGRLAILVVNKDPLQRREAVLEVEGFRPAGQAQVWVQDEEHLAEELPDIAPSEWRLLKSDGAPSEWRLLKSDGVVAETFSHTFPPYSVTLLVLEPVPWTAWLLWAGLGLILVVLAVLALRRRRIGGAR